MAYTQLTCLKMVYKRIYSKEYCLVEQGFCKLETEEAEVAKTGSNLTAMEKACILGVEFLTVLVSY